MSKILDLLLDQVIGVEIIRRIDLKSILNLVDLLDVKRARFIIHQSLNSRGLIDITPPLYARVTKYTELRYEEIFYMVHRVMLMIHPRFYLTEFTKKTSKTVVMKYAASTNVLQEKATEVEHMMLSTYHNDMVRRFAKTYNQRDFIGNIGSLINSLSKNGRYHDLWFLSGFSDHDEWVRMSCKLCIMRNRITDYQSYFTVVPYGVWCQICSAMRTFTRLSDMYDMTKPVSELLKELETDCERIMGSFHYINFVKYHYHYVHLEQIGHDEKHTLPHAHVSISRMINYDEWPEHMLAYDHDISCFVRRSDIPNGINEYKCYTHTIYKMVNGLMEVPLHAICALSTMQFIVVTPANLVPHNEEVRWHSPEDLRKTILL